MNQRSDAVCPDSSAELTSVGSWLHTSVPLKSAWAVCDNATFAATNFLVAVVVARHVSLEEYGTYALAQSIVLFLSIFHTAFITEPMLVFGSARYRESVGEYVSATVGIHIGMFLVIDAVLVIAILVLGTAGLSMWARALSMAAVGSPLILLGWFLRKACYIKKAPETACMAGVIYVAGVVPCIWILSTTGAMNGLRAFGVMGAAAIPASLWILVRIGARCRWPQERTFFADLLRQHLRYGRWALGAGAMRWVPFNVPLIALASSGSACSSGALRALMTMLMPAIQFFQAVNTMLIPFCAGRSRSRVARLVATAGVAESLAAVAYTVVMWLTSRTVLHALYAGKYDAYAWYLAPLSLLLVGEALGGVVSSALQALQLPRKVFAACLAGALLTALGTIAFRPFELNQAVWLIVGVYGSTAGLLVFSLYRVLAEPGIASLKAREESCV